jgi:uncharacterized membrane protein
MSKQSNQLSQAKRDAKKAAVLGTGKKNHVPSIIIMICGALAAGGIIWYAIQGRTATSSATSQPAVTVQTTVTTAQVTTNTTAEQVTYPVSQFISGQAQFFTYQADGLTIKYFIVRAVDGVIRAAFDACDVCWPAGKGYHQEGEDMVCNNCGRHFKTTMIGDVQGGCNPAPLKNRIENDTLILAANDLRAGKSYFDLAQGGK